MVEEGYCANGWLGILLGMRMWYSFYGSVLESEAVFEAKVDELCRELGQRGLCSASIGFADFVVGTQVHHPQREWGKVVEVDATHVSVLFEGETNAHQYDQTSVATGKLTLVSRGE